jgi:hypothetical protein
MHLENMQVYIPVWRTSFLSRYTESCQRRVHKSGRLCLKSILKKVLGRTNRLLSFIRHGPHWKRRVQQFFWCVCIRYRGNVYTETLPSNDRVIFTEPLPSNDKGIFTEPLPSNDRGDTKTATWYYKPTLLFQNKESRLKRERWVNIFGVR